MSAQDSNTRTIWILGDLYIDPGKRAVSRGENLIDLPKLSFDLLVELVHAAPNVLTPDELMDRVWQGAVVSSATVAKRVELLRQALGDDPKNPRYIAVKRGVGYSLIPQPRSETSIGEAQVPSNSSLLNWRFVLLVSIALAALASGVFRWIHSGPEHTLSGRTLAVLPFQSLSDDPRDQELADGLAEEVAHELGRSGVLRVAGWSSSRRARDSRMGPVEIGDVLGVEFVLEGTVRRTQNRLRVFAEILETANGLQRWSDIWELPRDEVQSVHRRIAERIAAIFEVEWADEDTLGQDQMAHDPEAYILHLKARSLMEYPFGADLPRAQELLEQAVMLDPDFAEAWALLGAAHLRQSLWKIPTYDLEPADSIAVARDAIDRALAADPNEGLAYASLAAVAYALEDDIAKAAKMAEQAARLSPWSLSLASFSADISKSLGRLDQANRLGAYVLERDPLCTYCRASHLVTLMALGDFEEAERQARLLLIDQPEAEFYVLRLGHALLLAGKADEALAMFQGIDDEGRRLSGLAMASYSLGLQEDAERFWRELESGYPGSPGPLHMAQTAAWLGYQDRALELLNDWVARPDWRVSFQVNYMSPLFSNLHEKEGWKRLLENIGRHPKQVEGITFDVTPYFDLRD